MCVAAHGSRQFQLAGFVAVISSGYRARPALTAESRIPGGLPTSFRGLSGSLKQVTDQVAALGVSIDKTTGQITAGADAATVSVKALADAWAAVAASARSATTASRAGAVAGAAGGGGGGRGGFVRGPAGVPIPGGGRLGFRGADAAMAGAGMVAYGVWEESIMEDAAARAVFTDNTATSPAQFTARQKSFRDAIDKAGRATGFSLKDLSEAGLSEVRQLAGLSWDKRMAMLPTVLEYAASEARLKGTSVQEAATSLIGLSHMTKTYDPAGMKNLFAKFGYLSTITDMPLQSMIRAYGYAVPVLQGSGIDPMQVMLLQSVMQRAGIVNTKSGTWI